MKKSLAAALFMAPSLAAATEIDLSSRIDRVTVYPDGAVVTRIGKAQLLQGASQIVLRGLPGSIDPASIRVSGKGGRAGTLAIGAVDVRAVPAGQSAPLDSAIETRLKALEEEKAQIAGRTRAIEGKRAAIERFARTGPERLGQDGKALPIGDWNAVFDAIGNSLLKVHEELRVTRARANEVDEEIRTLTRARAPSRRGGPLRDVAIAVEASAAAPAEFEVSYRVRLANWTPVYEARLATAPASGKPELTLLRRAELRQSTGEDWSDVALTLSTTRSAGATAAPDLPPVQVSFFEPPVVLYERQQTAPAPSSRRGRTAEDAAPAQAPEPAEPARLQAAELQSGAYQAQFEVTGRTSIPPDGSAKTVLLSEARTAPALSAKVTPELQQVAYLAAEFSHEEQAPLLPGRVFLHRDDSYIGTGRLELTPTGEKVSLGFGADDKIKVTRAPVGRRESEPGWLGQNRTDRREFRTVVKSLHAQPVTVTVTERIPFSENGAITVELLSQTTEPTQKQVGDKRGVSAWTFELAPDAEKEIRLAYAIRWPGDREVTYAPQPGPRPVPAPRPQL